ncbi:hypothetical protein [Candidatus Vallotia tarda]|uniref:hypothetical protein n=1 Tax=Candidatus Vallotiella hemipterorum TaxID=1177213 RepID=UPI001C1FB6AF|nr:hypothetical protein [Candidatus Vallotia tarda]
MLTDCNIDALICEVKAQFLRLQAARDAVNFNDIREFTTLGMFTKIKLALDASNS